MAGLLPSLRIGPASAVSLGQAFIPIYQILISMALSNRLVRLSLGLLSAIAFSASPLMGQPSVGASSDEMTVEISGLRNQKGLVCIALFDSAAGFPADATKAIKNNCFKVVSATQKVNLGPLKSGRYAMSILHDENADQKLNTGFLGIPREGIGFSRNPRIRRQLKFDETSFDFQPNASPVKVVMKYF
jgi:uncharacterized protein (DUF2141 family)